MYADTVSDVVHVLGCEIGTRDSNLSPETDRKLISQAEMFPCTFFVQSGFLASLEMGKPEKRVLLLEGILDKCLQSRGVGIKEFDWPRRESSQSVGECSLQNND